MSTAVHGMRVDATDRGFVCTVRDGPPRMHVVYVLGAIVVGMGVAGVSLSTVLTSGFAGEPAAALLTVVGLCLAGGALTWLFLAHRRSRGGGRVELDGERLRFLAVEGPFQRPLDEVKAVDLVPIGLAVRLHSGATVHLPLPGVRRGGREWLRDRIRAAIDRFGNPDEVPDALRVLHAERETR